MKRLHKIETCFQDIILLCIGLTLMFSSQLIPGIEPTFAWFIFLGGFSFTFFGIAEIALTLHWVERFRKLHERRMRHANSGVVWVWAVCLAGIVVYAIAFYSLVYPTLQLIGVVEDMTSWDPNAAVTLNLVKVVLNWHPIFFILGLILWAFVNSVRREDVTYPIGY